MIVVSLSSIPSSLRGSLTRWLFEIDTGVFVGRISARVRDELWNRIERECGDGQAIMVFGVDSEQRFDFRTHNCSWESVDLDGIKIMRRPFPNNTVFSESKTGFSKASNYRKARQFIGAKTKDSATFAFASVLGNENSTIIVSYEIYNNEGLVVTGFDSSQCITFTDKKEFLIKMVTRIEGQRVIMENSDAIKRLFSELASKGVDMSKLSLSSLKSMAKMKLPELRKHDVHSLCDYFGIVNQHSKSLCEIMSEVYFKMIKIEKRF